MRRLSDDVVEEAHARLFEGRPTYDPPDPVSCEEVERAAEKLFEIREGPYGAHRGRRYSVESRKRDRWNEGLDEQEHAPVTDQKIEEAYTRLFA